MNTDVLKEGEVFVQYTILADEHSYGDDDNNDDNKDKRKKTKSSGQM